MNKNEMNAYYKEIIDKESTVARQVGWRDALAQTRRFEQLYKLVEGEASIDIADLGCGLAGFYTFLKTKTDAFSYTGYDLSTDMILGAKQTVADDSNVALKLIEDTQDIRQHDFIVLSGIFNMKRSIDDASWLEYILKQLHSIDKKSTKGFAFNLLTSYSDEAFKKDELYYASPSLFFDYCKKNFSKNVALLHDYDEYDFTIIVRK